MLTRTQSGIHGASGVRGRFSKVAHPPRFRLERVLYLAADPLALPWPIPSPNRCPIPTCLAALS
jgi:hypothetical protein